MQCSLRNGDNERTTIPLARRFAMVRIRKIWQRRAVVGKVGQRAAFTTLSAEMQ